jgi:outer membrane protein assembly factor BamB
MTWGHVYGNAANTSFADVATRPAIRDDTRVEGLGRFSPGAGPVIGPDGTVYVANTDGLLRALSPAGALEWKRDTPQRRIGASPVVGADGSIYVVGLFSARDHRDGEHVRYESTLYRFDSGGAMVWARPFPEGGPQHWGSGTTTASPNIWKSGDTEVIIVPHMYPTYGGHALHVVAFSTTGALLFNHKVTYVGYEITSSTDWTVLLPSLNRWFGLEETEPLPGPHQLPDDATMGLPRVGMYTAGSGDPIVVVADNYQNLIGYAFSPDDGFRELFRKHLTRDALPMSSPVLLRDGHSAIVGHSPDRAWLLFGGPSPVNWPELPVAVSGAGPSAGAGGLLVVSRAGTLSMATTYPERRVLKETSLEAESIAAAAASRTHVFVSTVTALVTVDAATLEVVGQFLWKGGGLSTPAIGSDGRVYALAGSTLFCFAAPPADPRGPIGGTDVRDRAGTP